MVRGGMRRPKTQGRSRARLPGITLSLLLCAGALVAEPENPAGRAYVLKNTVGETVLLGDFMEVYTGAAPQWRLSDVRYSRRWRPAENDRPGYGFSTRAVWLRFRISNPDSVPRDFVVEAPYPMLDDVRLYTPVMERGQQGTVERYIEQRAGDRLPFGKREFAYPGIAFRVAQPALSERTYYIRLHSESSLNATLVLRSLRDFQEHASHSFQILGMFYAVLLAMLVFNLLLFLSTQERANLYFTVYLGAITIFLFTLDGLAFQYLWPLSPEWNNLGLPLWMALAYIAGLVFTRHYLRTAHGAPVLDLIILGEIWLSLLLAGSVFVLSYTITIVIGTAMASVVSLTIFAGTGVGLWRRQRPAYFFGIAWGMVMGGIFVYSMRAFALLPESEWSRWSIHAGVLLQVILLSLGLADRINGLRLNLRARLIDLRQAARMQRHSDQQYRHLVESTADIVFSLSADGRFLSANRAIQTQLGYRPQDLIGTPLADLVYRSPTLQEIMPGIAPQAALVERELRELIRRGEPAVFKCEFQTRIGEPRQLEVRLERVQSPRQLSSPITTARVLRKATRGQLRRERRRERETAKARDKQTDRPHIILGKAAVVLEDSVMRFLNSERQVHTIGNFLNTADLITERVTKNLAKYMDADTRMGIHICVREMVINAIEHGNLEVNYAEKTRATDAESYMQLLLARQQDPRFRDRKVVVAYSLNRKRIWFRIRDEGPGFDHRKLLAKRPEEANEAANAAGLAHGRGITMARNIFDELRYNDRGNQVTLIKRL